MTRPGRPAADVAITEALVRGLLQEQHPDLVDHPLRVMEAGWDNVMVRVGDALVVRLPRRQFAADLIRVEQQWLPALAPRLSLPVPCPVRVGAPTPSYPYPWSVLPYLPGAAADLSPPHTAQATAWAEFLLSLHHTAPAEAPSSQVRGIPLAQRAALTEPVLAALADDRGLPPGLLPAARALWQQSLLAPASETRVWVHGDLHPRNVLAQDGRVSGVIDWGDLNAGDPATDLASLWLLFDNAQARAAAWARYTRDAHPPGLRTRAMGWAVALGATLREHGRHDDPRHAAVGAKTLARVIEDSRRPTLAR